MHDKFKAFLSGLTEKQRIILAVIQEAVAYQLNWIEDMEGAVSSLKNIDMCSTEGYRGFRGGFITDVENFLESKPDASFVEVYHHMADILRQNSRIHK